MFHAELFTERSARGAARVDRPAGRGGEHGPDALPVAQRRARRVHAVGREGAEQRSSRRDPQGLCVHAAGA